jgi:UPF0716 protein FxsA
VPPLIAILVLALPLLEIAGFVLVGSEIGVLPTIGLVILSAVAGSFLLRWQGFGALGRIRREIDAGNSPGRELAHGLMIMLAGILLLIPGFITDIVGLLLFVPAVREFAWRYLKSRITVVTNFGVGGRGPARRNDGRTIDLDQDEYSSKTPDPKSPWRRPELE